VTTIAVEAKASADKPAMSDLPLRPRNPRELERSMFDMKSSMDSVI
jgi:hypothetical protein